MPRNRAPIPPLLLGAALLAVALAARAPGLGRSLWYDELFTLRHFTDTPRQALFEQRAANNHPLASLVACGVRAASPAARGDDPRALRAPSVLLGALGALAVGWLVRQRSGAAAAALGVLLAALHPAHVGYSQEVRGYAAVLLASPLVVGLALEGRRPRLLAVSVALGLLAHLSLLAVVVALAALAARERARATLVALLAGTAAALAVYAPMLSHLSAFAVRSAGTGGPEGLLRALELFLVDDARLLPAVLGAPLLALAVLGATRAPRLAAVAFGALLVIATAVLVARPVFYARFALVVLPLILALSAHGAAALARGRRALLLASPLLVVFAIATNRRASRELEPVDEALRAYPGARFEYTGLGAELHESAKDPTHRLELFAPEAEAQFHGLRSNVKVTKVR